MKKILVVGGGSIGERHIRCFQKTGRAEVFLCESNAAVRERVGSGYHLSHSWSELNDCLEESWDGVVICTPAHMHIDMATRFVNRQVPVLIEKPLSISLAGVQELLDRTRALDVPAGVAYVYRSHPGLKSLREAIVSGRFGNPVEIVITSGQHFPLYRPAYRDIYYKSRDTGGGAIQDALTHLLNAAEWLVGPVTRLVADAAHCVLEGVSVEDTAHVLTRHDHVLGSFTLNQHQAPNETTITVICDQGCIRFEPHTLRWLSCVKPGDDWKVEQKFTLERDDLFIHQANDFLNVLEGKGTFPCPLEEGLQTLRVNLAALQSVDTGKWVDLRERST